MFKIFIRISCWSSNLLNCSSTDLLFIWIIDNVYEIYIYRNLEHFISPNLRIVFNVGQEEKWRSATI